MFSTPNPNDASISSAWEGVDQVGPTTFSVTLPARSNWSLSSTSMSESATLCFLTCTAFSCPSEGCASSPHPVGAHPASRPFSTNRRAVASAGFSSRSSASSSFDDGTEADDCACELSGPCVKPHGTCIDARVANGLAQLLFCVCLWRFALSLRLARLFRGCFEANPKQMSKHKRFGSFPQCALRFRSGRVSLFGFVLAHAFVLVSVLLLMNPLFAVSLVRIFFARPRCRLLKRASIAYRFYVHKWRC